MAQPTGWTHVVLHYVGPNNGQGISVYFNGVEVVSDTSRYAFPNSAGDGRLVLGRESTDIDNNYGSVDVDELFFFNQTLSDQNIQDMSN